MEDNLKKAQVYDAIYVSLYTYDGNSNIMKAFYEAWCPSTNSLLTSFGELSISLWDLHTLGGLPMTKELTSVKVTGRRFIHHSCGYLIHAYHILRKSEKGSKPSQVSVDECVRFWFKKVTKYSKPPPRKEKKSIRPKLTYNTLCEIDAHREWSLMEKASFLKLGIEDDLREDMYLVAFLACWLCIFVLLNDNTNTICPSTFKMASVMTSDPVVGLAVPTLVSIYRGLNEIVNSPRPSQVVLTFPVHFIYGWLAHYFRTHHLVSLCVQSPKMASFSGEGSVKYYNPKDSRKRIHEGELISWTCTMISKGKYVLFIDNENAEKSEYQYFIAICSNYLPLWQGGHFIIEPYSPHRFSHQFGFYQWSRECFREMFVKLL